MVTKKTKTNAAPAKKKWSIPRAPASKVFIGRQPFPSQLFNTLKYTEAANLTLTGGFKYVQYSANGMYNPNITGSGHQPMYFDQLMAIYDHYTVLRSRFKITPGVSGDQPYANTGVVYIDDDVSVVSNLSQAIEMKTASKPRMWIPLAGSPPTIYKSWDAVSTFGPNPQAQDSLQGTASANPSEQSYFTYVHQDAGSQNLSFQCIVQIEYDVVWDELKTIAQS